MSKGSVSSHYVPRLILRKFSDKVCLYNVKTGELQENIVPEHAYRRNRSPQASETGSRRNP